MAELLTFTALASFENAIAAVVALSLFVPLCISTGGNSGSQAATLITRALALGQVTPRDWRRVLRHELLMGVSLGLTLGAIGFLRAALTPKSVLGNADRWLLALTIAESVAAICLWGTVVGAMLPLIFKRLGIDPGIASSPFVATFVDVTGIVIYFSIARVLLLSG
ncbi:MAG: magnesium transporter [Rhodopirellula sp.]|nr:magnesium transporter [Rhodopirellula sp.]